jgi:hypothetical protein
MVKGGWLMDFNTFKETTLTAREIAYKELSRIGISDPFRVRCIDKPKLRYIGQYKSFSQYSKQGTYFRIFSSIIPNAKEIHEDDIAVGFSSDLHSLILNSIVDTLLHEYGHVIFEYVQAQHTRLHKFILKTWGEEEFFAESFKEHLRGEAYHKTAEFSKILTWWKKQII